MRRRSTLLALVALVTFGPPMAIAASPGRDAAGAWRRDALWDDGNAELCAYDVTWPRYGATYTGRALLVLVKEPWAPDANVKADRPRANGFDVLKLNHIRDVPTGIYTYHQMASLFFRRDDASLVKLASSSAEACGVTTASKLGDGALGVHSYFDGVGDRQAEWPPGALAQDGLPATLRDWVAGAAPPDRVLVFPTLLDSKLANLRPRWLRVARRDRGSVDLPGGPYEAVDLVLTGDGEELAYTFERAAPHRLLELRASDGTVYRLARCGRLRYWEMHGPGGEQWLPPSVR